VHTEDHQNRTRSRARLLLAVSLWFSGFIAQACGNDSGADRSLDGAGNKPSAGTGGTSATHITPGAGTGGSGGSVPSFGATGGELDSAGASGQASEPPGPTDDGLSPYTVFCDDSTPCGDLTAVTCLHLLLDEGTRSTCSNDCRTSAECSDAPSGTDVKAECVQFTSAKHCVLVCYDAGVEKPCPDGMGCYRYLDSPIGYCLWP
jgi:hypothetical protein